ncbi:MAG: LysM peptidoglycan-binding domain-containing protein [candidate division Zixibacteria bacterium]
MCDKDGFHYTIRKGDTLSGIARRFGVAHWRIIYNHSENEAFKASHPDPNLIHPREVIWVPGVKANQVAAASGKRIKVVAPRQRPGKKPIASIKLVSITYITDHHVMLAKYDDWKNPQNGDERKKIEKPEFIAGKNDDEALPISHTWKQKIKMKVKMKVEPVNCLSAKGKLIGTGKHPGLSFKSGKTKFVSGFVEVVVTADDKLLEEVGVVEDYEIKWSVQGDGLNIQDAGTSKHDIYITTGTPKVAKSWPMANNDGKNHNYLTANRVRYAALIAQKKKDPHEIVKSIWESYNGSYDLSANGNKNPWKLVVDDERGQCMTICSFIESAAAMLGLKGQLVFVWPSFAKPKGKGMTRSHNDYAKAWAAASPVYQEQKRSSSKRPPHSANSEHHKHFPKEIVSMVDHATAGDGVTWLPGWNTYEATFRFTDNKVTKYYGGGGPIEDSPSEILEKVCALISWCYYVPKPGTQFLYAQTFCLTDGQESCLWWSTHHRNPWPPPPMAAEVLPG